MYFMLQHDISISWARLKKAKYVNLVEVSLVKIYHETCCKFERKYDANQKFKVRPTCYIIISSVRVVFNKKIILCMWKKFLFDCCHTKNINDLSILDGTIRELLLINI